MADAIVNTQIAGDGAVIAERHGELFLAVNKALHDNLIDAITTERRARVVVSLRHVGLLDSTGMSALTAGYRAARRAGVGLKVGKVASCVAQHRHAVHLFDHHVPARRRLFSFGRRRATGHRPPDAAARAPA